MTTGPDIGTQQEYYDRRWSTEAYANRLMLSRAIVILDSLRALDIRTPRILDLGSGTGWLTAILGRFGPATGIELSPVAVRRAQELYPDVRFLCADVSKADDLGESFDVVVSQEVVEHLQDQRGHLRWIERCLAPGGHLILTTPNARNLDHWTREELEVLGSQPIERRLDPGQLRSLLLPGFRILRMRTFIQGYGSKGVFGMVRSPRLGALLRALRLSGLFGWMLDRLGFGLHIVVVARLRP